MTHLSLFSGIGGLDLAAHWAGFKTVQFVERDEYCQKVLAKNFPGVPIHDDITTFDGTGHRGRVGIVSGGFPCQPFSVAGQRKGSGDERHLWPEMLRVIAEVNPKWVVAENVPGLLSIDRGRTFGTVVSDLAALGYSVGWGVLSAYAVGACHIRQRVFIVAYSDSLGSGTPTWLPETWLEDLPDSDRSNGSGIPTDSKSEQNRRQEFGGIQSDVRAGDASTQDASNTSCGRLSGESRGRAGTLPQNGYRELPSRDWRTWAVKPVFRSGDDGVPDYVVRHRVNILKALGNAVVPQQAYPIFKAIAEVMHD